MFQCKLAAEAGHTRHRDGAGIDQQFPAIDPIGKAEVEAGCRTTAAGGRTRGDRLLDRVAQGVDPQPRVRLQAHQPIKPLQNRRAAALQGIAALACGIGADQQAQLAVAECHTGLAGADAAADAAGPQQHRL